jgi:ferrous iron transport protein B
MTSLTVALAGNPNSGKTTVFNALTGSHQHVGNWPGKTVERKHGHFQHKGYEVEVIDLPGIYSLTPFSLEEVIARNFILDEEPDVVVAVVDASNLERNLYLVVQILELRARLIVVLNMSDRANSLGFQIDEALLSASLGGVPLISTIASRNQGIEELKEAIASVADEGLLPELPGWKEA